MRRSIFAALIGLAFAASLVPDASAREAAQLHDIQIESLTVRVVDTDGRFTVVDSRMDETATAAVFFGLIGAAVNSAANNAEDDAKAEPLKETAEAIDLDGLIGQAVLARLSSREAVRLAETPESASNTLVVEVGEWGLIRRAQRPDTFMRVFLKLNLSITDARGRTIWGPQREHSIGQMSAELAGFTPEVFRTEMEALAGRAGQQVANKIIYR
ncbi:MAG TPA: hypothetical protein DHW63_05275 [Hyphomonadaceae bacterium]|nr:hypothetical protein [Hyphomonadaceae bacterium]